MQDPDADTPDPIKPLQQEPSFVPATTDQLHKMNEFVSAYADMCENAQEADIWNKLKDMYHFKSTSEITAKMADKIIEQVECWYKKSKEKEAS